MRLRCLLSAAELAPRTDPALLPDQAEPVADRFALLPARVRRALETGLRTREPCFHVFVATPAEVAIGPDLLEVAAREAASQKPPDDLAYVHDFDAPTEPRPLALPAGRGPELSEAMAGLIRALRRRLPTVSRGEEFRARERSLARELSSKNREALADLEVLAKGLGFGVRQVPGGFQTFPILHGKPLSPEQFGALDEATQRTLQDAEDRLAGAVEAAAARIRALTDDSESSRDDALHEAASRLVEEEIAKAAAAFAELPDVLAFFERAGIELSQSYRDMDAGDGPPAPRAAEETEARLRAFAVHVVKTTDAGEGAPVVFERSPSRARLFGLLERRAAGGVLTTDFTRLRPGALIEASGGYLLLRAEDLLHDPLLWQRFKHALFEQAAPFEDEPGPLAPLAVSMRPLPAPASPRVLLFGPEDLYAALVGDDPDFAQLFRIKVEVDPDLPRTPETLRLLDGYLMTLARARGWVPFDKPARARLLDIATRIAEDRDHLAILLPPLEETAALASEQARARAAPEVTEQDVAASFQDRHDRTSSAARHVRKQVLRGEIVIETEGKRTGVVNGLAVVSINDVHFGQPMRITAVVSLGNEGLIDVEREAHLGGSVHTKGVAILRGILSLLFGQERPLSLRAQITFEQSYGEIDGDSASSSELYAILSALSDVGIDQSIAVTGSVNQLGDVQSIGGVCAKIEAFYDLCSARGLTGQQGVLLPRSNVRHLVLRDDVAEAIAGGKFQLYAVQTIQEGIEVLTGLPAGVRDAAGRFPAGSLFGRVERRIIELAERLRHAEHPQPEPMPGETEGGHDDGAHDSLRIR